MLSFKKIGVLGKTYRHIKRYRQILVILFKYGFGDLVDTLKIEQYLQIGLQLISRKKREHIEKLTRVERVRMALEELGPTFIKFGQILSTRPDLIPVEYIKELSKLQDQVSPFSYEEVREIIRAETGKWPEEIFETFQKTPIAAASIGQVHKATLRDSEEVVIKVQRPNIQKMVQVDLEIMHHIASLMEKHVEELGAFHPTRVVEEFAKSIAKELDYTIEAAHIERFAKQFLGDDSIYVPRVYRELTTERIITMEYVDGIKASDVDRLREEGYDLEVIATRGADLIMKQIFIYGFFHADPHPGNIFILPRNVICYLDFGMVGRITRQERQDFIDIVIHIVKEDARRAVDAILRITNYSSEPDREALERDIAELMDQYLYLPLKDIRTAKLLQQALEISSRHKIFLKPDLFLMMKALSTSETLGRMLYPDFNLIEHARPFVRKIYLGHFSPRRITEEFLDSGSQLVGLIKDIPGELHDILKLTKEGKIKIEFEHRGLDSLLFTMDRISNRIAFAIVLASLIIGSSLITLSNIPPKWHEIPIIGLAGFIIAGVIGLWLLLSIMKRRKM